jgi:hypothetical protein
MISLKELVCPVKKQPFKKALPSNNGKSVDTEILKLRLMFPRVQAQKCEWGESGNESSVSEK